MLDLNTSITQALTAIVTNAVIEQTAPLVERIAGLESQADEDMARIAVLEQRLNDTENKLTNTRALLLELSNRIAAWQDTQVEQPTQTTTNTQDLRILIDEIAHDLIHAAIEHHLEHTAHMCADDVEEIVDDKISDHCNDYDHDSFLTEIDEDAVRDAVRDCLEDARVSISVR